MATIPPPEHDLLRWCRLANRTARSVFGFRNSCIMTSHALAAFLREQGLAAEVIRAEVHAHPIDRADGYGFCLGWDGDGTRRPAAKPGCWRGHLAVTCGGYMLDPTLDQAATTHGARSLRLKPVVYRIPSRHDETGYHYDGAPWEQCYRYRWQESGLWVTHEPYHRQVGWKSRAESRPAHWADVVAEMDRIEGGRR